MQDNAEDWQEGEEVEQDRLQLFMSSYSMAMHQALDEEAWEEQAEADSIKGRLSFYFMLAHSNVGHGRKFPGTTRKSGLRTGLLLFALENCDGLQRQYKAEAQEDGRCEEEWAED